MSKKVVNKAIVEILGNDAIFPILRGLEDKIDNAIQDIFKEIDDLRAISNLPSKNRIVKINK